MTKHDVDTPPPPGYVGLAQTIVSKSGPIALLAVGFAAFLCVVVWVRLVSIERMMNDAGKSMAAFSATHTKQDDERNALMTAQTALLRQLCINSAKDEGQRRDCTLAEMKR